MDEITILGTKLIQGGEFECLLPTFLYMIFILTYIDEADCTVSDISPQNHGFRNKNGRIPQITTFVEAINSLIIL